MNGENSIHSGSDPGLGRGRYRPEPSSKQDGENVEQHPPHPDAMGQLRAMVRSYQVTQAVYVAAKLGIADLLVTGPQDAASLAAATQTDAAALARLMRALASVGVFEQV